MLQSCYLKVLDGSASYAGRASLKTWFFAVIRRTAASQRRRAAVRGLLLLRGAAASSAHEPAGDGQGLGPSERARIISALGQLPRRQREVLELVFYQDLSLSEAAEVMAVSLGTARAHYHRAKTAMAGRLKPLEGAL